MNVDQDGDAADQGAGDFTLLDAPGVRESTPRAMEASSTVNMIDDDGLGLSVPVNKSRRHGRPSKGQKHRRSLRTTLRSNYKGF
jgi:hypothetical protein